jgi:STE24 endopeptidase
MDMMAITSTDVKRYNKIKLVVSLVGGTVTFLFFLFTVASGLSLLIEEFVLSITDQQYVAFLLFVAAVGAMNGALSLPFNFYSGFILEHRYQLSNQTLPQWLWESVKGILVSLPIVTPMVLVMYYCLITFGGLWWLPVGILLFVVSIGLSRIAPILILPLFYRLEPIGDSPLKERIIALTRNTDMLVDGIFSFNLSKTTKKANAAFTGIGRSKRILLGDTLIQNFSDDEIETVFAHELGHYSHGHIRKGILFGTASIFLGLSVTSIAYSVSLHWFGFSSPHQLAALPLLTVWLGIYSLVASPLGNILSRQHEFEADRYAVATTGNIQAFVSTMNKLASMNLADTQPHPVVEFLFYSHPSIDKRIAAAETHQ